MKIAHIVPPAIATHVGFILHDYHLLLPSLAKDFEYREFYKQRPGVKIMDNGVAEGHMKPFSELLNLAKVLRCQEVVLPDVMFSMDGTLNVIKRVYNEAFDHRSEVKYMLVAQGSTVLDCVSTVQRALNMFPGVIYSVGIPRHILSVDPRARLQIVQELRRWYETKPIHLLGTHADYSTELLDLGREYHDLGVRGLDTSLAWNATINKIQLSDPESLSYNRSVRRQSITAFARGQARDISFPLLEKNIRTLNSWTEQ